MTNPRPDSSADEKPHSNNPLLQDSLEETVVYCAAVLETLAKSACDEGDGAPEDFGSRLILRTVIGALTAHAETRRLAGLLRDGELR